MGGKGSGRRKGHREPIPCGSFARYKQHRLDGEDCSVCREAARLEARSRYKPRPPRTAPTAKDKKQIVIDAKFERGACAHCKLAVTVHNWIIFEWDHIDPTIKSFGLSNAKSHSVSEILEELSKCQLLCSNCHQLHTYTQGHYYGRIKRLRTTDLEDLFAYGLGNA